MNDSTPSRGTTTILCLNTGEVAYSYKEYLRTKWWKSFSSTVREMHPLCSACGAEDAGLHVHHLTYVHVGNELPGEYVTLCPACHNSAHGRNISLADLQLMADSMQYWIRVWVYAAAISGDERCRFAVTEENDGVLPEWVTSHEAS
jgi:hypothetical protein